MCVVISKEHLKSSNNTMLTGGEAIRRNPCFHSNYLYMHTEPEPTMHLAPHLPSLFPPVLLPLHH